MYLLFIVRISLQKIFKAMLTLSDNSVSPLTTGQDNRQVCLIDSNSKHIWENKTEGASLNRPHFPPTDFSRPRLTFRDISDKNVSKQDIE